MKRFIYALLLGFFSMGEASASQCEAAHQALQKVGETRLKVFFFNVYDAALYTDTGRYADFDELVLRIDYLRDISAEALVDRTREEWQKQGINMTAQHENWLTELNRIWPNIEKGDCLVAHWQQGEGMQFINRQGELGSRYPDQFARDFVGIWLAENASYPKNRNELVGASND